MKELFKKTAAPSGKPGSASASGSEEKSTGSENKTSSSKTRNESSRPASGGHGNFFKKFFSGIVKYRFAISCAAVVLLTAVVINHA